MKTSCSLVLLVVQAACAVLLPSQDPFYTQPANISAYKPGDVIQTRQIPTNLNNIVDSAYASEAVQAAYQLLYRTTDNSGNAVAAVTTLLVPFNANPGKLLAYQQAYDSANNDCSPSYAIQSGANTTALADIIMIIAALDKGWYVVSPDYEGLNAQYTTGLISGYATLDSVRAVLSQSRHNGLRSNAKYVMWGYSGGSLASEWAAELQPVYAPELNFQGAALGGLIPNVSNVLSTINQGPFAGLAFSGIYGQSKGSPGLTNLLDEYLIDSKKDEFYSIANGCVNQAAQAGFGKDVYSYFTTGQATFRDPRALAALSSLGQMGVHGVPKMPLFVYKAIGDEISPSADTDALVTKLCGKGATVTYHKDAFGEHITEAITGAGSAMSWLNDRLNGIPVSKGCSSQYVFLSSVDVGTIGGVGTLLIAALQNFLGGKVGLPFSG